mgnify:CR=1 FL=1
MVKVMIFPEPMPGVLAEDITAQHVRFRVSQIR